MQDFSTDVKIFFGFAGDGALAGSAVAAWLLEIEHVIGGVGAGLIFLCALIAGFARAKYWWTKAAREAAAFKRDLEP